MNKVVVLSPSRFSFYTICVAEMLIRNNVQVSAIFVKKLLNPNRFLSEFSRDGSRLLKKIWKKLILREKAYRAEAQETIVSFMRNENINFKRVDNFKTKYGIPVLYCNDLNDSKVVKNLKKIKPDLVIFTGGGLIREEVLENSGSGILNCHMGILPQYRGMDVIEWAILEDNFQQIGVTVHFMDKGVDTGDILRLKRASVKSKDSIKQIRDRFEPLMCREITETSLDYLNGKIERIPQKQEDGKQYFIMHPRLMKLAEAKLNRATFQIEHGE